ncbi:MAG: dephospho-CoA kinase [Bacilli bacterium]|nr:dephospho-CoA kinase [Bacilli bacterium]MBP5550668.1 dephospho-CoA kinase [Bacilli bacterium]
MKKVAITGGIATGKSSILQYLMMKGYVIYSSDSLAHDVLKNEGKQEVLKEFGRGILSDNGEINRSLLGKIVFNDLEKLDKLNKIIHPYVKIRIEEIIKANPDLDIIFFEVPLLFEAKMEDMFDVTINIYCDIDTQIERIVARDGRSIDDALNIIKSQMGTYERNKRATYAIDNTKEINNTYRLIDKILGEIL